MSPLNWADVPGERSGSVLPSGKAEIRSNVIWILLDGCRAKNLGCYGYERDTSPALDALAAEGVLFREHFAQASKTYNSVPSFMTGRYFPVPCFSKRYSQTVLSMPPAPDERMIGEIMRRNGYSCAMVSNMPLFQDTDRLSRSFDEVFLWKQGERSLLQRWEVMNEKLYGWLDSRKDNPFFLYIHASDTHFPHEMVPPYDKWIDSNYDTSVLQPMGYGQNYQRKDNQAFNDQDKEYLRAVYDGMILDADEQIRLLVEHLRARGLLEKTVIVVTADHGQLLGEDGFNVAHMGGTDEVLRIPLIMRGPGIPSGVETDLLTENVDIVPTLVDLLALETEARFDGYSLVPEMRGESSTNGRTVTFSVPDRSEYENPTGFILRTNEAKFEYDGTGTLKQVFQVPDSATGRIDITGSRRDEETLMTGKLQEHYLPLLKEMQALPVTSVVLEAAWLANRIQPREHVVDNYISGADDTEEMEKDNKWAFSNGFLWTRNGTEEVPDLAFDIRIPEGVYTLNVRMYNSQNHNGTPASSVKFRFAGEERDRNLVCVSLPPSEAAVTTMQAGTVTLREGRLAFTLRGGAPGFWTMLHSIELFPVDARGAEGETSPDSEDASPGKDSEYHELMRGLGYM